MRVLLVVITLVAGSGLGAVEAQAQEVYEAIPGEIVPQQPYQQFATRDQLGRVVNFYVSEELESTAPLPLVVYVHGSGAQSHFVSVAGRMRGRNGHSTIADVVRGRARLVIVEKPGVSLGDAPSDPGGAIEASPEFRIEHTLDRWVEAVHAAVQASRGLSGVESERILVIGHSEGGIVAAKLAAKHDLITHVAVLAGGGPSQLYSLLTLARDGTFFGRISTDPGERVAYVLEQWTLIQSDPDNVERLFFGHPYRRWSSFLSTSTMEQLLRTEAKMFVAQGTEDRAVAVESFEILRAELLARGKDATFRRVTGADHNFVIDRDGERTDVWGDAMNELMSWFLAPE